MVYYTFMTFSSIVLGMLMRRRVSVLQGATHTNLWLQQWVGKTSTEGSRSLKNMQPFVLVLATSLDITTSYLASWIYLTYLQNIHFIENIGSVITYQTWILFHFQQLVCIIVIIEFKQYEECDSFLTQYNIELPELDRARLVSKLHPPQPLQYPLK